MKRVVGIILCWLLLCSMPAGAVQLGSETILSLPDDWSVTAVPAGRSGVEMTEGDLRLYFDTTDAADRGRAEVTTGAVTLGQGVYALSMDTAFTDNAQVNKSLVLKDNTVFNTVELLRITGTEAAFFGGAGSVDISGGSNHRIVLALDIRNDAQGAVWVDGQLAYQGSIANWKPALDLSAVQLLLRNTANGDVAERSEWTVAGLSLQPVNGRFNLVTQPQDQEVMVDPSGLNGIQLDFGTRLGDNAYLADNYTLQKDDSAEAFTLTATETGVQIVPDSGFAPLSTYTLTIPSFYDLLGQELTKEQQISFTTAYAGYEPPEIEAAFQAEELKIYKGQTVPLEFTVTSGEAVQVDILIDGQTVAKLNQAPYLYNFKAEAFGEATVQAIVWDAAGGRGYSEVQTLTVLPNNPPELTVDGLTDGGSYEASALPVVQIHAQDDIAVERIQIAVDGTVVQEMQGASGSFDLSGVAGGSHLIEITAIDIYGLAASMSFQIELTHSQYQTIYQNDFSDYGGNNTLPDGMGGNSQRGYLDVGEVDAAHGKSLLIGIDVADESYAVTDTAYVGIPAGGSKGANVFEFDILISAKPARGDKYRLAFKRTGGAELDIAQFHSDQVRYFRSNGAMEMSEDYVPGEWMHFTIKTNVAAKTYEIYVNGKPVVTNGALPSTMDQLDHLRIFGPAVDTVKGYAAVDNVTVQSAYGLPQLTFDQPVDYTAAQVTFTSSEALHGASLTPETVTLTGPFGKVNIQAVSAEGNTIVLTLPSPLSSNTAYTVTLLPEVRYLNGPEFGIAVTGSFTTSLGMFEILDGRYDAAASSFVFQALNSTGKAVEATIISQVWHDNQVRRVKAQQVTIPPDEAEAEYTVPIPALQPGEEIRTFIWDGLVLPEPLSPVTFVLKN